MWLPSLEGLPLQPRLKDAERSAIIYDVDSASRNHSSLLRLWSLHWHPSLPMKMWHRRVGYCSLQ